MILAMRPLAKQAHIHLVAICGTAMGSLAGMLKEQGYRITGSDTGVYPPMSTFLAQLDIPILIGFDAAHLEPAPDLVVIGNAVSRGNPEVEAALDRRIPYLCLPEVLRDFFLRDRHPLVITGTHGKTTTTALSAHLLHQGKLDPSFLIAGLPRDFDRPFHLGNGDYFVLEGDEYDSAFFAKVAKFFYYMPRTLIINNIEFDHADIYDDLEAIKKAFRQLINLVPQTGAILANADDPVVTQLLPAALAPVQTFGFSPGARWRADAVEVSAQGQSFTLLNQDRDLGRYHLPLSGAYNVRNALAAIAAAFTAGVAPAAIRSGLAAFKGVRRRQEWVGTVADIILIDDFAHHPTAVGHTLEGLRQTYPQKRLWSVFEPASATNARALFESRYLEAFSNADGVVIAKVPRPERARGDAPFSPQRLVENLQAKGKTASYLTDADAIVDHLNQTLEPGDLVVFMSNGGFGNVQRRVLEALKKRFNQSPNQ